ncbi:MAG: glycosyltransferase family 2 protein [Methylococcales bacterium]|nr:glycosyltransferase family 2 protein [Methylococcales bacterium]
MNKVSIVLCVYNAEETLAIALDSILNQTYREYELVVVNDGSTDGSIDILNAYQNRFPAFKLIHQENRGLGPARNTAISQASHDLIAFIDGDDLWHQSKLELQISAYNQNPDAACIICDCQEFYSENEIDDIYNKTAPSVSAVRLDNIFFQLAEINFDFQPVASLWKKDAFMALGGFTHDRSGQDYYPFLVSALHDLAFYRIHYPLYYVRVIQNSLSRSRMSPYLGALARVNAIDRILSSERDLHQHYLTAEKIISLEKGKQKFSRWVLYGIRVGFPKSNMPSEYMKHLFRITDKKVLSLELFKLMAVLLGVVRY